jgi:hypothetical protein
MPTLEEINKWADALERECPEELPERLEWFTRRLGIELGRLLRLMGLSPDQVARLEGGGVTGADWDELVQQHPAQALWVEDAINQLLAAFHYDADALAHRLRRPPATGETRLPRLGGEVVNLEDLDEGPGPGAARTNRAGRGRGNGRPAGVPVPTEPRLGQPLTPAGRLADVRHAARRHHLVPGHQPEHP